MVLPASIALTEKFRKKYNFKKLIYAEKVKKKIKEIIKKKSINIKKFQDHFYLVIGRKKWCKWENRILLKGTTLIEN